MQSKLGQHNNMAARHTYQHKHTYSHTITVNKWRRLTIGRSGDKQNQNRFASIAGKFVCRNANAIMIMSLRLCGGLPRQQIINTSNPHTLAPHTTCLPRASSGAVQGAAVEQTHSYLISLSGDKSHVRQFPIETLYEEYNCHQASHVISQSESKRVCLSVCV